MEDVVNMTSTANTVYENKMWGIYLRNGDDSVIENNYAHHNAFYGILVDGGSQGNVLKSNIARYNNLSGIRIFSSNSNLLLNNIASYNEENGILLESCNSILLTGNTANNNEENGIHLLNSNSNTIISNTANNNKNGTFLDTSNNNDIVENLFVGNDDCYNETGSTGNIFENNRCSAPGSLAVDLSTILLILVLVEGAVIAIIALTYFVRKRK